MYLYLQNSVLGYTQTELETYFADYLQPCAAAQEISREQLLRKIQQWYNGYSWNGKDRVYNPFSISNLFANNEFDNYWFASGTPTFLINLIKQTQTDITQFDRKRVPKILFDSYELDKIDVLALLFQTGYLTITDAYRDDGIEYVLNYPNREVKDAFLTYLFESFTDNRRNDVQIAANQLRRCLRQEDVAGFLNIMRALFAKIPYSLHLPEEAYYHSLFYMIAALLGVEIDLEVLTDKGRIDGVLEFGEAVYIIEFKHGKAGSDLTDLTDKAIRQIQTKKYAERFRHDARKRILLGIGFAGKEIGYQRSASTAGTGRGH